MNDKNTQLPQPVEPIMSFPEGNNLPPNEAIDAFVAKGKAAANGAGVALEMDPVAKSELDQAMSADGEGEEIASDSPQSQIEADASMVRAAADKVPEQTSTTTTTTPTSRTTTTSTTIPFTDRNPTLTTLPKGSAPTNSQPSEHH